ncbi:MAG TPA: hypothetical protein VHX86_06225 [Tepidisphaeraceae bacterium]|jgi:hypothetical protein|nr:hypothetical protein [Tepidisphaeraceae bacterium]
MADRYLKLYRIKEINIWPYEDVVSVTPVDRNARATLTVDFAEGTKYRCYRHHPGQFVDLAPMETYDESWEGADNGREISPYRLFADRPLAMQIEYVLFHSYKASDYSKLHELIENIKKGILTPSTFPKHLRPARVILQGDDESHPWSSLRLDGTTPPDHPTSAFIIAEHSDLPYINNHTIPKCIDHEYVHAAIVNYDFYKTPPTYDELLKRLDKYCDWFQKLLSESARKPLKSTDAKPKKRK